MLGSKYNPCRDIKDVKKAMKNMDERIYVDGILDIPYDVRVELSKKGIRLWVVSKNDTNYR